MLLAEDIVEEGPFIAPLMNYSLFWYWMMIFVILGIILVTMFLLTKVKPATIQELPKANIITNSYVTEMNKVYALVSNNQMTVQEGYQRVSIILREFLSSRSNLSADSMTLEELAQSAAPPKVLQSIASIYPVVFGNKKIGSVQEFNYFMNTSRQILDGWWN